MKLATNARLALGVFVFFVFLSGCSTSRSLHAGVVTRPGNLGTFPAWATDSPNGALLAATDSLATDADWLIDSLAVPIDTLAALPGDNSQVPDISDSLAAATQARLPSMEELFDYPVVVNRRVLSYIDFFLGRSRKLFEAGLVRSGRYLDMSRRIFQEEGIPQDLVFLAHVESSFKYNARSRARAIGLWQFIRGTARLYGLRCDSYVDERLDPERETRASARYLHDLYKTFGDWHLALAAYNTGAGNVERAIQRAGTRDFWRLAETRYLMNETRNFVPAILAATILAKSPGAYGMTEETDPPLTYDSVVLSVPTDLRVIARCCGASLTELKHLNPALLVLQTPPHAGDYEIRVPAGLGERLAREITSVPPTERLVYERHSVRRGETLAAIAHRYGTTVRAVQDANQLGRSTMIRVGQTLTIPSRNGGETPLAQVAQGEGESVQHRVCRGETLSKIAARYGVTVETIQRANRLSSPNRISIGQSLVIPVPLPEPEPDVAQTPPPAAWPESLPAKAPGEPAGTPMARVSGSLRPLNATCDLGRGPSTAHLVERARQEILTSVPSLANPTSPSVESSPEDATATAVSGLPAPKPPVHIVRRGDTLGRIADRYGTDVAHLLRWNRLRSGRLIYPGQRIRVGAADAPRGEEPQIRAQSGRANRETARTAKRVHVVSRGDSLWRIAQRYGVRLADLLAWNSLRAASRIYPGQRLLIQR
jgi:membrane-bound lytic murein transglycosylase D